MTEEQKTAEENHETTKFTCTNPECRAHGTVLEHDEITQDDVTGAKSCVYCGETVSEEEE